MRKLEDIAWDKGGGPGLGTRKVVPERSLIVGALFPHHCFGWSSSMYLDPSPHRTSRAQLVTSVA